MCLRAAARPSTARRNAKIEIRASLTDLKFRGFADEYGDFFVEQASAIGITQLDIMVAKTRPGSANCVPSRRVPWKCKPT
jgi:hypothetical protein